MSIVAIDTSLSTAVLVWVWRRLSSFVGTVFRHCDVFGEAGDVRPAHGARGCDGVGSVLGDCVEGRVGLPPQLEAPCAQRVSARNARDGHLGVEADGAAVLVVVVFEGEQFAHHVVCFGVFAFERAFGRREG